VTLTASARQVDARSEQDVNARAPIRIVIVDPALVFAAGLTAILGEATDLRCVGTAATELEARQALTQAGPDLVMIAATIPKLDVAEFIRDAVVAFPDVRFVALGDPWRDPFPTRLIDAGVRGYLMKDCDAAELFRALRAVGCGQHYVSSPIASVLVDRIQRAGEAPWSEGGSGGVLTERELEVLELLALGRGDQAIAAMLQVSVRTAENHVHNLYRKLEVHNRANAIQVALRHGFVPARSTELWLGTRDVSARGD
jgi:DNA-binding NarL/FixJ family response regulator